jgi:hypothetical protein
MAKFRIGDAVQVKQVRTIHYETAKNDGGFIKNYQKDRVFGVLELKEPTWAQITGLKMVYEGHKTWEGDEVGWMFHQGTARSFVCVRFGMRNKEELIDGTDILEIQSAILPKWVPSIFPNQPKWTEEMKKVYRSEAERAKRDEKGRFLNTGASK